ncbi:MAG: four-carbon acid sugar kinase family protein [Erysipelotrichaceae bacterium]|nr:four-carbon acid sugar kinase family protein [Erysipelotrichaceae bacterium]
MTHTKQKIKLGVIADDFTGASDAASFLVKAGYKVVMVANVQDELNEECDALVVALKIRSVLPEEAIKAVKETLVFFEVLGVEKIYYKYCSTFDSTPTGNIGVVLDYLMDYLDTRYTIICPSLPINGRTVKDGILYVNNVALAETSMKDHPLNPMWDSYIPNLMKNQSKHQCYISKLSSVNEVIDSIVDDKFYLVPDYHDDNDGKKIATMFKDLKLLSGGSGLLEYVDLGQSLINKEHSMTSSSNKAVIICGSCSKMTGIQIKKFIQAGNPYVRIDSEDVLNDQINANMIFEEVLKNLPKTTIVFSDGVDKDMSLFSKDIAFKRISSMIEEIITELSELVAKNKFDRIVIAGGETSGAVTIRLGYKAYAIGKVVAPGVPILIPLENKKMSLVLKSGNFGDENFFVKAIE